LLLLIKYQDQLNILKDHHEAGIPDKILAHVGLYGTFFDYQLRRLDLFSKMEAIAVAGRDTVYTGESLSESSRQQLIKMNNEIYSLARQYDEQAAKVPGNMMAMTRADSLTLPFKERVSGYDISLDNLIRIKQFDGQLNVSAVPQLNAGQPFELKVELRNRGCIPWISEAGYEIKLEGETRLLGLPDRLPYEGPPIVFGDKHIFTLKGIVPAKTGEAQIKIDFLVPSRAIGTLLGKTINLKW
jgi:hypothetical protein